MTSVYKLKLVTGISIHPTNNLGQISVMRLKDF